MKKKSKKELATPNTCRPRSSQGTAILGKVIPELTICGVFNVTDAEASYLTKGITTAILAKFQMDLLQASGLLVGRDEDDQY